MMIATGCEYAPLSKQDAANTTILVDDKYAAPSSSSIIPELETYQWQDNYFDTQQDVIAVFDHDLDAIARSRHAMLVFALVEFVLFSWMWIFVSLLNDGAYHDWNYVLFLVAAVWVSGGAMAMIFHCARLSRIAPPHTAVTRQGVLHVNGGNYWGGGEEIYFIPWNGIVDFSIPTHVGIFDVLWFLI